MRTLVLKFGIIASLALGGVARAGSVPDPVGDFLSSFTGAHDRDLDVTSFSVSYDAGSATFLLKARLAGNIDASKAGFYVIGANTGTGVNHPFGAIGEGNVIFNQAIVIQKAGTGTIGGVALAAGAVTILGREFSVVVPLARLASTGFAPTDYGFNLWPRNGSGLNAQISDFSPENANLTAVPEAATWAMMIAGFGLVGGTMRRRRLATA
jgi:hypothetical protein